MALNDDLLARMVGHQIGLLRLSAGIAGRLIALLDAVDEELVAAIRALDLNEVSEGRRGRRLNALLEDIRIINVDVYRSVQRELTAELRQLADYEVEYQLGMLDDLVPVEVSWRTPSRQQLMAAVLAKPFEGYLLREWAAGLESGRRSRVGAAIRLGYAQGETVDQVVRRVRGTAAANYKDGVLEISRRSARNVVRTAVNHVATQAREALYDENAKVIKGVEWVSTLDTRTTPVCRARDGKVYLPGKGPRPPAHQSCRSTTAPVVKSWRELGVDIDEAPPGTRASMDGQVAGDLTYGSWLRTQSTAVQDEVLGVARARLFRAGLEDMDRFVDRTGRAYSLTELKRREGLLWKRAGLGEAV